MASIVSPWLLRRGGGEGGGGRVFAFDEGQQKLLELHVVGSDGGEDGLRLGVLLLGRRRVVHPHSLHQVREMTQSSHDDQALHQFSDVFSR